MASRSNSGGEVVPGHPQAAVGEHRRLARAVPGDCACEQRWAGLGHRCDAQRPPRRGPQAPGRGSKWRWRCRIAGSLAPGEIPGSDLVPVTADHAHAAAWAVGAAANVDVAGVDVEEPRCPGDLAGAGQGGGPVRGVSSIL